MLSEKIRILLLKRKKSITWLASQLGISRNNLSNKLARDKFSEKEIVDIANALDCDYEAYFIMKDTGEKI